MWYTGRAVGPGNRLHGGDEPPLQVHGAATPWTPLHYFCKRRRGNFPAVFIIAYRREVGKPPDRSDRSKKGTFVPGLAEKNEKPCQNDKAFF